MDAQKFDPFISILRELFCGSLFRAVDSRIFFHNIETQRKERKLGNLFRIFNSCRFFASFCQNIKECNDPVNR